MHFEIVKKAKTNYDWRVILVEEGEFAAPSSLSEDVGALFTKLAAKENFSGKPGQCLRGETWDGKNLIRIVLAGYGKKNELTQEKRRAALCKALKPLHGTVLLESAEKSFLDPDALGVLAEHLNYRFEKYKTSKKDKEKKEALNLEIVDPKGAGKTPEGSKLGVISNIVRDLVNEPANNMTPAILAGEAEKLAKTYGLSCRVYNEKEIAKFGMTAFLAVGSASAHPPRLVVLRYTGNKKEKTAVGLVGKGLCYDAGGLSIKPTASMLTMKSDMTGAATVIGVLCALAENKVPKNAVAVIAACENVIDGAGYKPGDIVTAMNGKTIEITNTDAEGRVTLADALTYIREKENVSEIIDVATLTGAIMVALGEHITGVFTNTKENFDKLAKAGEKWGERFWNMPMDAEFAEMVKSHIADLKNSAGRWGGASSAAKFLEEFVDGKPWMHLDIAGTSFSEEGTSYYPKGATGETVKTLYSYIKDFA